MACFYEHSARTLDGREISLREYEGKVALVVNTASRCGFTVQYEGLERLHRQYRDQGFVILGFPCNQFGEQEPGDEQEIARFCSVRYHITFPMFAKIEIIGDGAHPLYRHLNAESGKKFGTDDIKWNFTKFLIDRQGNVANRFAPQTKPASLARSIEALL